MAGAGPTCRNTPFREYKHWVHEGGISTPLIAHWPKGIAAQGELRKQPGHLIDIAATCVDLAGRAIRRMAPRRWKEESLRRDLRRQAARPRFTFWEHEGNRAVRSGKWKLVAKYNQPWELYDIAADRVESHNLAATEPDRVKQMADRYAEYAKRTDVEDWSAIGPKKKKKKD